MIRRLALAAVLGALAVGGAAVRADAGGGAARPDARLALLEPEQVDEIGNNVYQDRGQQSHLFAINPGDRAVGRVRFQNDANVSDTLRVGGIAFLRGGPIAPAAAQVVDDYKVKYRLNGDDVTRKVAANKLRFHDVAPGQIVGALRVVIKLDAAAEDVLPLSVVVHVTSANDRSVQDVAVFDGAGAK